MDGLIVPGYLGEAGHGTLRGGATMATKVVRQIRKATRRKFSAEEKVSGTNERTSRKTNSLFNGFEELKEQMSVD